MVLFAEGTFADDGFVDGAPGIIPSFPAALAICNFEADFLAIALGSNLPAYWAVEDGGCMSAGDAGAGEIPLGATSDDVPLAFSSISARSFRVAPGVASFCFSLSSCLFFHAASLASRSAFLPASAWEADGVGA